MIFRIMLGVFFASSALLALEITILKDVNSSTLNDKQLKIKNSMSKRNIIDLYPIEIHKNKDLLSLHNGDILLFLSPKNKIKVHKFKISKIKKRAKFSTLIAKHIDGVEKGRITLSLINDKLSGTITLPNNTYLLKTFNEKGWIGIEPKREFDDNDTVQISPDTKNLSIEKNLNTKQEEQGKIFKKSRALIDGKYQIKWLVLASQVLVDTFDSKEDFELRLENVKEDMNQIYEDSKINAELDLVHYEIIDVADPSSFNELIMDMREPSEKFINLESLRHKYQANNISLILNSSGGAAGKGNVGYCYRNTISDKSCKWTKENNIVSIFSSATLVHEIGHNMGLNHSYAQGSKGSIFEFGRGHGVDGKFVTIMAYPNAYNTFTRLPLFSDPNRNDCKGLPCGISHDKVDAADSVYAINAILPYFTKVMNKSGKEMLENVEDSALKECYEHSVKSENNSLIKYTSQIYDINCTNINTKDLNITVPYLQSVKITKSNIKTLSVSNSQDILFFDTGGNDIRVVNFGSLKNVILFSMSNNHLEGSLDLSNKPNLTFVHINDNNLTSIDLKGSNALQMLFASNNNIEKLILPENAHIKSVSLNYNPIDILKVENLKNIKNLDIFGISIKCWQKNVLQKENNITNIRGDCTSTIYDLKDTDNDGINNLDDIDDDNDGISDLQDNDIDGDGIKNDDEIKNGLSPLDATDAELDSDGDGYTNKEEIMANTDIRDKDSKPAQDTKYLILKKGWNLIAPNRLFTLDEIIQGIDISNLLIIQGPSKTYKKDYVDNGTEFLNDFTGFEEGKGYWVKVQSDIELSFIPSASLNDTISLEQNWNLINPTKELTIDEIKTQIGVDNLLIIQGSEKTYKKEYVDNGTPFLNDFEKFEEPKGYWIKVNGSSKLRFMMNPTN